MTTITAANTKIFYKTLLNDYTSIFAYLASLGTTYAGAMTNHPVGSTIPPLAPGTTYFPASNFDSAFFFNFTSGTNSDATYIANPCSLSGALKWSTPQIGITTQITNLIGILGATYQDVCIALDAQYRAPGDTTPGYCMAIAPQDTSSTTQCISGPSTYYASASIALIYLSAYDNSKKIYFSETRDASYKEWSSVSGGTLDYPSFLSVWYGINDDTALWMEAPWIITYLENQVNASCLMTPKWEWIFDLTVHKSGPTTQCAIARTGDVMDRRHRVRGKGRAIQLNFASEAGKPFNLLGWSINLDRNANY